MLNVKNSILDARISEFPDVKHEFYARKLVFYARNPVFYVRKLVFYVRKLVPDVRNPMFYVRKPTILRWNFITLGRKNERDGTPLAVSAISDLEKTALPLDKSGASE